MAKIRFMAKIRLEDGPLLEELRRRLTELLPSWKLGPAASWQDHPYDLMLRGPEREPIAVVFKAARDARAEDVEGRLAVAILSHRRLATGARTLFAIRLPTIRESTVRRVQTFMREHAPDTGWLLFGPDDDYALELPWAPELSRVDLGDAPRSHGSAKPRTAFTDLNCWLLKLLLLHDVAPPFWGGPRAALDDAQSLMSAGAVSRITAYRFVKTFVDLDYLRETKQGLEIVRRGELIREWRAYAKSTAPERIPVQWMFGHPTAVEDVFSKGSSSFAVTGFDACRRMHIAVATFENLDVYVSGHLPAVCKRLALTRSSPEDAHFFLWPASQSALRARHELDGVPIVDALQAALDVSLSAARGREQSDYILHDVLGWRDV